MTKDTKKEFITKAGNVIEVDTSDKACEKFGFKSGQTVVDPDGNIGVVAGVAPPTGRMSGNDELWIASPKDDGKIGWPLRPNDWRAQ